MRYHCYKTVKSPAESEITEKKSRFIASVSPAESIDEATSFIESVRKKHPMANHNVYAYQVIDAHNNSALATKCSDDGEPSSTAGAPILNILLNEKILNVVVVVTRYFGGTLLGTGGLVRSYSLSAREGLTAAHIVEKKLYHKISVISDYNVSGMIQNHIKNITDGSVILDDTMYTDAVENIVLCEFTADGKHINMLTKKAADMSRGTAVITEHEKVYLMVDSQRP